jgi:cardiolipin synthase
VARSKGVTAQGVNMNLTILPDDGAKAIVSAIDSAKKTVEVTIFRFDRKDIEAALRSAVGRGVKVTALVAHSNRGGEKLLRKLEMRFLQAGITVTRTADDLVRYHGKMLLIDRRILHVLAFNFTNLDMAHSRAFSLSTNNPGLLKEAIALFEADCTRTAYSSGHSDLAVSPVNARKQLASFLGRARQQLLIYDPEISDPEMTRIISERMKAGVAVRIIGHMKAARLEYASLSQLRLHTRTIVRDRRQAFVGSQSLRALELDRRREIGVFVRDQKVVRKLIETFEADWATTDRAQSSEPLNTSQSTVDKKDSDKVARLLVKELQPVAVKIKRTVKRVAAHAGDDMIRDDRIKSTVKKVVKRAVKEAVREVAAQVSSRETDSRASKYASRK